jgi:hypothetical protein
MSKGKKHHPAQTGFTGRYGSYQVDLGQGVGIRWTAWKGETVGGILSHPKEDAPHGRCEGAFYLRGNKFHADRAARSENERKDPQWDFNGDFEKPDLNPSFLCHCGFHGFVRNGQWVSA